MKPGRSVLVTGGNGFIGRHLVGRLLQDGCAVTLLQRSAERIHPSAELLRVDRLERSDIDAALGKRRFEWLFHLAAYGVKPFERDAETMHRVNVEWTRNLMEVAAAWSPRALIVAGSCSEYNFDGVTHPVAEDWPLERTKMYGASKALGTMAAADLASSRNLPFAACRIFGVYGPGEAPHRLLPSLINGLRSGDGRVPLSPGLQLRDFLHIDDVVEALMRTATALENTPQQTIANLSTGRPIEVREFARTVAAALNEPETRLGFGDLPMRPDEPMIFSGIPDRLTALTGWRPAIELPEGIRRCVEDVGQAPNRSARA